MRTPVPSSGEGFVWSPDRNSRIRRSPLASSRLDYPAGGTFRERRGMRTLVSATTETRHGMCTVHASPRALENLTHPVLLLLLLLLLLL